MERSLTMLKRFAERVVRDWKVIASLPAGRFTAFQLIGSCVGIAITLPIGLSMSSYLDHLFGIENSRRIIVALDMAATLTTLCVFFALRQVTRRRMGRTAILRPPASFAVRILRAIFPAKAFDAIFSQVVIDFREEHSAALAEGNRARARWMAVCLWGTLGLTTISWVFAVLVKRVVEMWRLT